MNKTQLQKIVTEVLGLPESKSRFSTLAQLGMQKTAEVAARELSVPFNTILVEAARDVAVVPGTAPDRKLNQTEAALLDTKPKMPALVVEVLYRDRKSTAPYEPAVVIPLSPYAPVVYDGLTSSKTPRPSGSLDTFIISVGSVREAFAAGADMLLQRLVADALDMRGLTPPDNWGFLNGVLIVQDDQSSNIGLPSTTDVMEPVQWDTLKGTIWSSQEAGARRVTPPVFAAEFVHSFELFRFVTDLRAYAKSTAQETLRLIEAAGIVQEGEMSILTAPNGLDIQVVRTAAPRENIPVWTTRAVMRVLEGYARAVGHRAHLRFTPAIVAFTQAENLRVKADNAPLSFAAVRDRMPEAVARDFRPLASGTDIRTLKPSPQPERPARAPSAGRPTAERLTESEFRELVAAIRTDHSSFLGEHSSFIGEESRIKHEQIIKTEREFNEALKKIIGGNTRRLGGQTRVHIVWHNNEPKGAAAPAATDAERDAISYSTSRDPYSPMKYRNTSNLPALSTALWSRVVAKTDYAHKAGAVHLDAATEHKIREVLAQHNRAAPGEWAFLDGKLILLSDRDVACGLPSESSSTDRGAPALPRETQRARHASAEFAQSSEMTVFTDSLRAVATDGFKELERLLNDLAANYARSITDVSLTTHGLDVKIVIPAQSDDTAVAQRVRSTMRILEAYASVLGAEAFLLFEHEVHTFSGDQQHPTERETILMFENIARAFTASVNLRIVPADITLPSAATREFTTRASLRVLPDGAALRFVAVRECEPSDGVRDLALPKAGSTRRPTTAPPPKRPTTAPPPRRPAATKSGIPRGEPTASIPVVDLGLDEVDINWDDGDLFGSAPPGFGSRPPVAISRDPYDPQAFYADVEFDDDFGGERAYVFKGHMHPIDASAPRGVAPSPEPRASSMPDVLPVAFAPPPSIRVGQAPADMDDAIPADRQMLWFVVNGADPRKEDIYRVDAAEIDSAIAPVDSEDLGELVFVVKMLRQRLVELFRKVESHTRVLFLFGFSQQIEAAQIYTDQDHLALFPLSEADAIIQVYIPTDVDLASKISFEDITNILVAAIAQLTGVQLPEVERDMAALDLESVINYILRNPDVLNDPRVRGELARLGVRVDAAPRAYPKTATLMLRGGQGVERVPVTFKIVDADDLVPSNVVGSFSPHPRYPTGLQERDYFNDVTERLKVEMNAQRFDPVFAVNTNPDAMNGPPVITPDGIVLGGNSRTMSMQLVYASHPARAEELKRYLVESAPIFGLTEADVTAVAKPVLVRVMRPAKTDIDSLRVLVRQMNEGHAQRMTADVEGRALASRLSQRSIDLLSEGLTATDDPDAQISLRDFLTEYTDKLKNFVTSLRADGVITDTNSNMWIDQNHSVFTPTAVALIESVLLGKLFSDTQKLARLPPALKRNLVSALPAFLGVDDPDTRLRSLALAVDAYSLASTYFKPRDTVASALDSVQRSWVDSLYNNVNEYDRQVLRELIDDPIANRLLVALIAFNGPRKLATAFKDIAGITRGAQEPDVEDLFAVDTSDMPLEERIDAYLKKVTARTHFTEPRPNPAGRRSATSRGGFGELMRRKLGGLDLGRLNGALIRGR
jgi:hypothetical protein